MVQVDLITQYIWLYCQKFWNQPMWENPRKTFSCNKAVSDITLFLYTIIPIIWRNMTSILCAPMNFPLHQWKGKFIVCTLKYLCLGASQSVLNAMILFIFPELWRYLCSCGSERLAAVAALYCSQQAFIWGNTSTVAPTHSAPFLVWFLNSLLCTGVGYGY